MRRRPLRAALAPLGIAFALAVVLGSGLTPALPASRAQASTADTMESDIFHWINDSRAHLGLQPLQAHVGLWSLAGDRAATMASTGVLNHTIAGCLSCQLNARGIPWYVYGEAIAYTSGTWGDQSALALFNLWKGSAPHWGLLMNYIGIGVAYRSADGTSWGSVVMTESVDQTRPWAKTLTGSASGTTVTWTWGGADVPLQTHTSGLHNYDVEYHVDSGSWGFILSGVTRRYLVIDNRAPGHYYGIRVRSRDWRGNVSAWSAELRVWVR